MFKRIILTLFTVVSIITTVKAQLINDIHTLYNPAYFNNYSTDSSTIHTPYGAINSGRTNYNISFGTGYTSFGKGIGFSNSYISPSFAYSPSDRLQVVVGATLSYNNFQNVPSRGDIMANNTSSNGNPSQLFAFSRYQLTSKLSVFAMVSFAKNQLYASPYLSGIGKMDYNEFGVGFNYKLGEKTTIGASFNFSNGSNFGFTPFSQRNQNFPF